MVFVGLISTRPHLLATVETTATAKVMSAALVLLLQNLSHCSRGNFVPDQYVVVIIRLRLLHRQRIRRKSSKAAFSDDTGCCSRSRNLTAA
jgi:hypothetical protein